MFMMALITIHSYYIIKSGISSSIAKTFYFEDYLKNIHYLLEKYGKSVTFDYMRSSDQRLVVFLENGPKVVTNNLYTIKKLLML